jgi:hypothetical protein
MAVCEVKAVGGMYSVLVPTRGSHKQQPSNGSSSNASDAPMACSTADLTALMDIEEPSIIVVADSDLELRDIIASVNFPISWGVLSSEARQAFYLARTRFGCMGMHEIPLYLPSEQLCDVLSNSQACAMIRVVNIKTADPKFGSIWISLSACPRLASLKIYWGIITTWDGSGFEALRHLHIRQGEHITPAFFSAICYNRRLTSITIAATEISAVVGGESHNFIVSETLQINYSLACYKLDVTLQYTEPRTRRLILKSLAKAEGFTTSFNEALAQ